MGFVPRENPAPKDLRGFFETDTVFAPVAFCFFIMPLEPHELEIEHFPILAHSSPSKSLD
jgi:hypothetical protein